jgi:predicted Zn-dependent peptidase
MAELGWNWRRIESRTLREAIYESTHPSGLRVYFCPKPGYRKKYAAYSTFYGSIDLDFVDGSGIRSRVPDGIAHFLEHTLFETERGNVSDLFARNGAYSNAATSFTTTSYLFASSDRFYENLELLVGFVEQPCFRADRVEKERGIIEQEIKGYDDSPDWVSFRTVLESLFQEHPIRIDIAGTGESIGRIDVPALERCYRSFYHPSNMSLFVIGDIDPTELGEFLARRSRGTTPWQGVRERQYPVETRNVARPEKELRMEVALPKLFWGFKEVQVPSRGVEYVRRELLSELVLELVFGRSTDLFRDLYETELVLDDFASSYSCGAGIGYAIIGGDTPDPEGLRAALEVRAKDLLSRSLETADFEREKRRFIGTYIRGFNSLEYIASHYSYFRFYDFDLFDAVDLLDSITREDVETRLRQLIDPAYSTWVSVIPQ